MAQMQLGVSERVVRQMAEVGEGTRKRASSSGGSTKGSKRNPNIEKEKSGLDLLQSVLVGFNRMII